MYLIRNVICYMVAYHMLYNMCSACNSEPKFTVDRYVQGRLKIACMVIRDTYIKNMFTLYHSCGIWLWICYHGSL